MRIVARLKYHQNMWLRDDLAAQLDAWEDVNGVLPITSAGRLESEQQRFIDLYFYPNGTVRPKSQRPDWLFEPYRPAKDGPHVRNGGEAFDVSAGAMRNKLANDPNAPFYRNIPNSDPVHFVPRPGWKPGGLFNQDVANRQGYLNDRFNAGLKVDGVNGPATRAAIAAYQTVLGIKSDGIWGPATQAAHDAYVRVPAPPSGTPIERTLRWYGIQAMLQKLYGYKGSRDNDPGDGTMAAFDRFLKAAGYWDGARWTSAQRWLQAKHGYKGKIDGIFGDGSRAAWVRAENANWKAFK